MKECDEFSRGSLERFFVDQANAGAGRLRELAGDVVGPEGDVMEALAPVGNKLGDRAKNAVRTFCEGTSSRCSQRSPSAFS
jgi:hypothetical protein